jgi:uncharacterized protein (TIGR02145 family)
MRPAIIFSIALVMAGCDKVTMWPAIVITTQPTGVTQERATLHGQIVKDKFTSTGFEFGTTTEYGEFISDITATESKNSNTPISCLITTLTPNTTYHYRLTAKSSHGTVYGDDISFTTKDNRVIFNPDVLYGMVTDIDGNKYKTIQVGTQTWMAENLKTTRLNEGTPIRLIGAGADWMMPNSQTAAYCWLMDNVAKFKDIYGALYNWHAVGSMKLCPAGWHVPADDEWKTLTNFLGGVLNIGEKIKETGGNHWPNQGPGTTNSTGFTALPAGYRNFQGTFMNYNSYGVLQVSEAYWWTSTSAGSTARYEVIYNNSNDLLAGSWIPEQGLAVRCLKDN